MFNFLVSGINGVIDNVNNANNVNTPIPTDAEGFSNFIKEMFDNTAFAWNEMAAIMLLIVGIFLAVRIGKESINDKEDIAIIIQENLWIIIGIIIAITIFNIIL